MNGTPGADASATNNESPRSRKRAGGGAHRGGGLTVGSSALAYQVPQADILPALSTPRGAQVEIALVPRRRRELPNRIVNIILASIALVIAAPVMLLVALAVRLTSRGPVVYTQTRVGIDRRDRSTRAVFDRRASDVGGLVFTIYKFRTMRVDAEKDSGAVWATKQDPRCTVIGQFLRRTRLDELPQLFNVLLGDMNIVGPRPERPRIFQDLRESIAEYPLRQKTKPGITGLAQINHDYDTTIDDVRVKVRYDLEYLARQSLWEDIKIMLKTIPVMLFKKGGW